MQTFLIEIEDGRRPLKAHQVDLANLTAARIEAARLLSTLIKHEPESFWVSRDWQLRIRDEHGTEQFHLSASAAASAAKPG